MKRTSILIVVLVIVSLMGASIAAAQEPGQDGERQGRRGGRHVIIDAVVEATGLTVEEIREAMQAEDATLASIIEANGGDIDEVVAQIVATITENSDKDPAEVEEKVRERLTTPPSERPQRDEARPGRGEPPAGDGEDT